jgi:hypothetical protein
MVHGSRFFKPCDTILWAPVIPLYRSSTASPLSASASLSVDPFIVQELWPNAELTLLFS